MNWLSLKEILKYEPIIISKGVSKVARSENGFLSDYKRYKYASIMKDKIVPNEKITWEKKRENFIKRTLPQFIKNPTPRRYLSLITWAYKPKNF